MMVRIEGLVMNGDNVENGKTKAVLNRGTSSQKSYTMDGILTPVDVIEQLAKYPNRKLKVKGAKQEITSKFDLTHSGEQAASTLVQETADAMDKDLADFEHILPKTPVGAGAKG